MKLYNLVHEKVGCLITSPQDKLYKEALLVAEKDIEAHKECSAWEYDTWSEEHQLEYKAFTMAVYVIMEGR